MTSGAHSHPEFENIDDRLDDLERRVEELEGGEPEPPPPSELPYEGDLIGRYRGADEVALQSTWPSVFNSAVAAWDRRNNLRVVCPSGVALVVQRTHRAPTIRADGKLTWIHDGARYDHSQVMLEIRDDRMARIKYYLQPDRAYGLSCETLFERWVPSWIQVGQRYGRVHESMGGDGMKDVTAWFIRDGKLYSNVYGATPEPHSSQRIPVNAGDPLHLAHAVKATARGTYADSWFRQDKSWRTLQKYLGRVGTGVPVAEPDNLLRPLWGPYTSGDLGLVVYDNIQIHEVED